MSCNLINWEISEKTIRWEWTVSSDGAVLLFSIFLLGLFTHAFLRVLLWTVLTQVNKSLFFPSTSQEIPSFIFQVLQTEFYPCDFSEPVKFENWSLRFWSALCEDNSCNFGTNMSLFVSLFSSGETKQKNPTLFNSVSSKFGFIAKIYVIREASFYCWKPEGLTFSTCCKSIIPWCWSLLYNKAFPCAFSKNFPVPLDTLLHSTFLICLQLSMTDAFNEIKAWYNHLDDLIQFVNCLWEVNYHHGPEYRLWGEIELDLNPGFLTSSLAPHRQDNGSLRDSGVLMPETSECIDVIWQRGLWRYD